MPLTEQLNLQVQACLLRLPQFVVRFDISEACEKIVVVPGLPNEAVRTAVERLDNRLRTGQCADKNDGDIPEHLVRLEGFAEGKAIHLRDHSAADDDGRRIASGHGKRLWARQRYGN